MTAAPTQRTHRRMVHPRWVWAGILLVLLGLAGVGLGLVLARWPVAAVGVVVAAVGGVSSWRGGVMYDVHGTRPLRQEVAQVVHDDVREGSSPDERIDHARAEEIARRGDEERREALDRVRGHVFPPLAPIGVVVLLVAGVWLFIGQFTLSYPFSVTGEDTGLRDTGLAVVVLLSALRLRQLGPSSVATGLCLLVGVLLVVSGGVTDHSITQARWNELMTGGVVLVAAALTMRREAGHREDSRW